MNLAKWLSRHIEWSSMTFGPGARSEGICKHIEKELAEVRQNPTDVTEWIDIVILALDGAWRSGHTIGEICTALEQKQIKNEQRKWRLHRQRKTNPLSICAEQHEIEQSCCLTDISKSYIICYISAATESSADQPKRRSSQWQKITLRVQSQQRLNWRCNQ